MVPLIFSSNLMNSQIILSLSTFRLVWAQGTAGRLSIAGPTYNSLPSSSLLFKFLELSHQIILNIDHGSYKTVNCNPTNTREMSKSLIRLFQYNSRILAVIYIDKLIIFGIFYQYTWSQTCFTQAFEQQALSFIGQIIINHLMLIWLLNENLENQFESDLKLEQSRNSLKDIMTLEKDRYRDIL